MKTPQMVLQQGLSLLESMLAMSILGIGLLSFGPLLFAGYLARCRAELRTAAIHLVQNRQELSRAALRLPGGCNNASQNGQETVTVNHQSCRLNWSIQPVLSGVPSSKQRALAQITAVLYCPTDASEAVIRVAELQSCRRE